MSSKQAFSQQNRCLLVRTHKHCSAQGTNARLDWAPESWVKSLSFSCLSQPTPAESLGLVGQSVLFQEAGVVYKHAVTGATWTQWFPVEHYIGKKCDIHNTRSSTPPISGLNAVADKCSSRRISCEFLCDPIRNTKWNSCSFTSQVPLPR